MIRRKEIPPLEGKQRLSLVSRYVNTCLSIFLSSVVLTRVGKIEMSDCNPEVELLPLFGYYIIFGSHLSLLKSTFANPFFGKIKAYDRRD